MAVISGGNACTVDATVQQLAAGEQIAARAVGQAKRRRACGAAPRARQSSAGPAISCHSTAMPARCARSRTASSFIGGVVASSRKAQVQWPGSRPGGISALANSGAPGRRIKRHRHRVEIARQRQYRAVTQPPARHHRLRPDRLGGQRAGSLQTRHDLRCAQMQSGGGTMPHAPARVTGPHAAPRRQRSPARSGRESARGWRDRRTRGTARTRCAVPRAPHRQVPRGDR